MSKLYIDGFPLFATGNIPDRTLLPPISDFCPALPGRKPHGGFWVYPPCVCGYAPLEDFLLTVCVHGGMICFVDSFSGPLLLIVQRPFFCSYSLFPPLIASKTSLSGHPIFIQLSIVDSAQRTLPPMRIGAGIFPQLFRRKIWRLERLSNAPNSFAVSNWISFLVFVFFIIQYLSIKWFSFQPMALK